MKISVISFTRAGARKNLILAGLLQESRHQAASYSWHKYTGRKLIPFQSLDQLLGDLWDSQEAFIFLSEIGLAVRAAAKRLREDQKGPAIFVMDEAGSFFVPLSEGRLAGAKDWCCQIAGLLNAVPVVTRESQAEAPFLLDTFAGKNGLHIQDMYRIEGIREKLAAGEQVGIYSDYPIDGVLPEGFVAVGDVMDPDRRTREPWPEAGIAVTDDWEAPHFVQECRMYPVNLVLGLYCRAGSTRQELDRFISRLLAQKRISRDRICAVFSLEQKAREPGLLQLANRMGVPLFTYTAEQLAGTDTKNGTLAELCQRCAQLGSSNGRQIISCREADGMRAAVYERRTEINF